jgi:hypothetical protein
MEGKVIMKVDKDTPGAKERLNKDDKTVYEIIKKSVDGYLTKIEKRTHESYGDSLAIHLVDGEEKYVVNISMNTRYASAFLKTIKSADLSQKIELIPNMKIVGEEKKTTLFLKQNDQTLGFYYNKAHPNGLPELVKVKYKGKETWDNTDQVEFLMKMIEKDINPHLSANELKASTPTKSPAASLEQISEEGWGGGDDDQAQDLPF